MVAYLTAPLKDRRHILRERDLRLGRLPARGNCREQRYNYDGQRDGSHTYLRERSLVLVSLPLFLYRTFLLYANSFVTYCMFAEARAGRRCKKIRACMFRNIFGKPQHDECNDTNPRRRYLCLSMFAFQRTKPHKL